MIRNEKLSEQKAYVIMYLGMKVVEITLYYRSLFMQFDKEKVKS